MSRLCRDVMSLEGFYYVSAAQNKNFAVFRFTHWIVHTVLRFDSIKMVLPVCGHSYMKCDKNFALLTQRADAEVSADRWKEARAAREKPPPFVVTKRGQNLVKGVRDYLIFKKSL